MSYRMLLFFCLLSFSKFNSLFALSEEALAKKAQNPVADLISLPFQNNTNFDIGPKKENQNILNIQPVYPINATSTWNIITRTIMPVISQPQFLTRSHRINGIGDTTFTAFLSPAESGKLTWGVGPAILLPTASNDALGLNKWAAGPSIVALAMPGQWVIGALASNIWDFAGSGERSVNFFTLQYFVNYNLPNGWYLTSAPIITSDWTKASNARWTVPFGGGIGKILKLGKLPINAQLAAYKNVKTPELFGANWQLRAQIQLLFPKG